MARVSPFAIGRAIGRVAGDVKRVSKTKAGTLFIEVGHKHQARDLMKLTALCKMAVSVTAHKTLNSSKGVIRWRDLLGTPVEEIRKELGGQGVTHVHQMTLRRGGKVLETATYVLTFDRPTPPQELKCGYQGVKVQDYIPSPMRCFKCQGFGHIGKSCKRKAVCGKCAKLGHSLKDCKEKKPSCANCQGSHPAFSKKCPNFIEEREIQSVRTLRKISFSEARKVVRASRAPVLPKSYADAAATKPTAEKKAKSQPGQGAAVSGTQLQTQQPQKNKRNKGKKPAQPQAAGVKTSAPATQTKPAVEPSGSAGVKKQRRRRVKKVGSKDNDPTLPTPNTETKQARPVDESAGEESDADPKLPATDKSPSGNLPKNQQTPALPISPSPEKDGGSRESSPPRCDSQITEEQDSTSTPREEEPQVPVTSGEAPEVKDADDGKKKKRVKLN